MGLMHLTEELITDIWATSKSSRLDMLTSKMPGIEITRAMRKVFLAEQGLTKSDFVQADTDIGSYNLTSRKRMATPYPLASAPSTSKSSISWVSANIYYQHLCR
jgi:hypothetical protein